MWFMVHVRDEKKMKIHSAQNIGKNLNKLLKYCQPYANNSKKME